jgi:hypothetical protein
MPQLIKKVEGEIFDQTIGGVTYLKPIIGELQEEDFIDLNGLIAYLQNLTRAEEVDILMKPLSFGLKNNFNIPTVILQISY